MNIQIQLHLLNCQWFLGMLVSLITHLLQICVHIASMNIFIHSHWFYLNSLSKERNPTGLNTFSCLNRNASMSILTLIILRELWEMSGLDTIITITSHEEEKGKKTCQVWIKMKYRFHCSSKLYMHNKSIFQFTKIALGKNSQMTKKFLTHEIHILSHLFQRYFCKTPSSLFRFFSRFFNAPT